MTLKLSNPRKTEVFFDTEKLGRLYIFTLVWGDMEGFYKEVKSVEKLTPAQYVRLLVKYVCHPEGKLEDGQHRPKQPTLSDEDVNLISDSEFEDFAEKYITKKHFNRRWVSRPGKGEEGVNSVTVELGEVEHPRSEGEKWVDYLYRLAVIHEKELNEQFRKIAEQFAGIGSFSKKLQEQIKNTFSLGDSLKKSFEAFNIPRDLISKPHAPPFDLPIMPDIKPFGGLPDKIDKLIDISSQSADFLVEMNKTQIGIADELKSSGEKTAWYSKLNIATGILIGIIIIGLTILGIYLSNRGPKASDSQNTVFNKNIERLGNELKSLNENTKAMLGNNKAGFEQLIQKDADSKGANQKLLLRLIEQQNLIITELKNLRDQDRSRIEALEKELKELSRRIVEEEVKTK
jgi:hypothetical protein